MIYDKVMQWQNPVKEGYEKIRKGIANIDKTFAEKTKLSVEQKSKVLSLTNQAQAIADRLEKDGS